jgi:hypothetical protein
MNHTVVLVSGLLIAALPRAAIAITGLILLRSRLRTSHPRAYRFGSLGFGALLLGAIWSALVSAHAQLYAAQVADKVAYASMLTMANVFGYLLQIAAWALILAAILADRGASEGTRNAAQQPHAARRDT